MSRLGSWKRADDGRKAHAALRKGPGTNAIKHITYLLALIKDREDPNRDFQPLTRFNTNPAGAAIVNTVGPLRHVVVGPPGESDRRYLVIVPAEAEGQQKPVQIQLEQWAESGPRVLSVGFFE